MAALAAAEAHLDSLDDEMTTPPVLKEDSPIWQEYLKDANGRNLSPVSMKRYMENGDPVEFWLNLN